MVVLLDSLSRKISKNPKPKSGPSRTCVHTATGTPTEKRQTSAPLHISSLVFWVEGFGFRVSDSTGFPEIICWTSCPCEPRAAALRAFGKIRFPVTAAPRLGFLV